MLYTHTHIMVWMEDLFGFAHLDSPQQTAHTIYKLGRVSVPRI